MTCRARIKYANSCLTAPSASSTGDDEDDNAGKNFSKVDAYAALMACARQNVAAVLIKSGIGLRTRVRIAERIRHGQYRRIRG